MILDIIKLTFLLMLMFSWIYTLIVYYIYYRKYRAELANVFQLLVDHSIIRFEDYFLYEQLGVQGFGYLVSIISMILKGKRIPIDNKRWIEPDAGDLIRKHYDLSWIRGFYRNGYLMGLGFGVGLIYALLDKIGFLS
ncbi:hypothetical protein [Pseudescherichia sp.]|uniref:hypothetical protein n=1 Tax=Pseudescherichia sp. TaxID=2055881 RepID=UPI0028A019DA|nr:hypothetical protein [Pseudescherichia sp.]